MIGRNTIDGPINQSLDHSLDIFLSSKRRIDSQVGIKLFADFLVSQRKMMWRHFGRHFNSFFFRFSDRRDRAGRRDMSHMQPAPDKLTEFYIAQNGDYLADRIERKGEIPPLPEIIRQRAVALP